MSKIRPGYAIQVEGYPGWFLVLSVQYRPVTLIRARDWSGWREFDFPEYKIQAIRPKG